MIGRDSQEDRDAYGPWPWIGGLVFAAVLIMVMFKFAASIS